MTDDIQSIDLEEAVKVVNDLAVGEGHKDSKTSLHESDCLHRVIGEIPELQRKLIYYKKALEKIRDVDYRGNRSSESIMAFNYLKNGP